MRKRAYFDDYWGGGWPSLGKLKPYFQSLPNGRGWFHDTGNDGGSLTLQGVDGTEHLEFGRGRVDINLLLWGNPDLGVLLIYEKIGGGHPDGFCSKGDVSRIREWVRSTHDTPLPVGLFVPFAVAWKAVKEFIESEGQLPKSIEWIKGSDLPPGTFPDP
jgi:Immunity protein Imm1